MVYLIIMVLVAAIGMGTLYWQQRSQRAHLDSVEGFRQSLEKIAPLTANPPRQRTTRPRPHPRPQRTTPGRRVPLDARQRAEARRRLEERRRIEARRRERPVRAARARNAS